MRKKMFLWAGSLTLCLSLLLPSGRGLAAEHRVSVTLPTFEVKLNGNKVENEYREYPLLVYRDITYVPMTWYDSRLLGLETEWTQQDGLNIAKGKVTSSYVPYKTDHKHSGGYKAAIPAFKITINGRTVDNSKEEYPLLSFNNVIYFPLTWKFAHDEWGWEYVWDDNEGLNINSGNPQVKTVDLPTFAGENDVAVFKGYYYFAETIGNTNHVYRAPVHNTSNKEPVYSYDVDASYSFNKRLNFENRDDELWFSYHVGGAIMGYDVYCKVNDNGKAAIEQQGYLDFKQTPNGTLTIHQFVPPGGNNLLLAAAGQENQHGKRIGNPNLIYGWHVTNDGTSTSFGPDRSTTVLGDDVYVLASSYPVEHGDLNKIYKINIKTNETEKIIHAEVSHFKILNHKLYYVKDADHSLYSANLDGTDEQKLSDLPVANWYDEIDGQVYYTAANVKGQFHLYRVEPSKEDALVIKEPVESVQFVNDKIICKLAAGEGYGVKVLDQSGDLHLAITDQASDVFAYHDFILMVSAKDQSIKVIQ
ncbi:DUF5050 domain-containing protein [Paenibacillus naphthalenovorans]|uniref:DUF5050 domain-containing protein n=1 Tax=Paenibacillus naphthalenovorans TaxID=162209 RepID=UPI0010B6746F|nr:DUF5050 domain-containing protein [Paenibacillus naphthalenovorans]GCL71609.1 DUF5050 domain-containing protein [Paenibacillus naphthalenovorans]